MTPPENGGSAPAGSPGQPPDGFSGQQGDAPGGSAPQDMPAGGGEQAGGAAPGMNGASGGADLNYTDDDPDSYQTIWDGEIGSTSDADHERVISALRSISEGSGLEDAMDIDNLLRYMAVHVFSVNEDSLSGNMAHNYYLYESDGRLNIIPWDYNLALGGMGGGDADSVVNSAIDDAFTGTTFFDTLMDDESYHSRYYAYLRQLVTEYVNGGGFDAFYERVRSQIDELVETDPTAFYDYEEYEAAAETLYIGFIACVLFVFLLRLIKDFRGAINMRNMTFAMLLALELGLAQYSGALLRRPNASFYLAVTLAMLYYENVSALRAIKKNGTEDKNEA